MPHLTDRMGFGCNLGSNSANVDCVIAARGTIDFADNGVGAGSELDGYSAERPPQGSTSRYMKFGIVPIYNFVE
jgi:hypothetical protein